MDRVGLARKGGEAMFSDDFDVDDDEDLEFDDDEQRAP
jgi:hypothetical protein